MNQGLDTNLDQLFCRRVAINTRKIPGLNVRLSTQDIESSARDILSLDNAPSKEAQHHSYSSQIMYAATDEEWLERLTEAAEGTLESKVTDWTRRIESSLDGLTNFEADVGKISSAIAGSYLMYGKNLFRIVEKEAKKCF